MKKIVLIVLFGLVLVLTSMTVYLKLVLPDVGDAEDIKITVTPERVERGAYLANHVAACMDCHSTRDWSRFSGPLVQGTLGKGGEYFGPEMGFPGQFYSANISPIHLDSWTDGEIFRAITSGVNKDGKALFPVMPYPYYGKMDREDIYDIIAYIRQLEPIENKTPLRQLDFPMNFILNTIPSKPELVQRPNPSDPIKYGAYLANMAACMECHTQVEKGSPIAELAFGGGREFIMPNGTIHSANITPDKGTGIGSWSETTFINRFKAYEETNTLPQTTSEQMNTVMPWNMYAGMDTTDLKAIYAFIRTVKPVENQVPRVLFGE